MVDNYRKYYEKIMNDPLPPLEEDERIYLNVSYKARGFAKVTNCGFDSIKKLWFTGVHNTFILQLVDLYSKLWSGNNNSHPETLYFTGVSGFIY